MKAYHIQMVLAAAGLYRGKIDGKIGPKTMAAVAAAEDRFSGNYGVNPLGLPDQRRQIAAVQACLKFLGEDAGTIDGWAATYFKGRLDGVQVEHARQVAVTEKTEAALASVSAALRRSESVRLQIERIADNLQEELENEARTDPDADRTAVSAAGMRRINQTR